MVACHVSQGTTKQCGPSFQSRDGQGGREAGYASG